MLELNRLRQRRLTPPEKERDSFGKDMYQVGHYRIGIDNHLDSPWNGSQWPAKSDEHNKTKQGAHHFLLSKAMFARNSVIVNLDPRRALLGFSQHGETLLVSIAATFVCLNCFASVSGV